MDGAFKVAIFANERDVWVAQLMGTRLSGEQVNRELEVRADNLIDSMLRASEIVLAECTTKHWASSGIESLRFRQQRVIYYRAKKDS